MDVNMHVCYGFKKINNNIWLMLYGTMDDSDDE